MFRIITTVAIISLGSTGLASAETMSTKVAFGDLDISKPAGAQVLLARIDHAGRKVCGGQPNVRDLGAMADFRRCRTAAVSQAVRDVRSPVLTALYEGSDKSGVIKTAKR